MSTSANTQASPSEQSGKSVQSSKSAPENSPTEAPTNSPANEPFSAASTNSDHLSGLPAPSSGSAAASANTQASPPEQSGKSVQSSKSAPENSPTDAPTSSPTTEPSSAANANKSSKYKDGAYQGTGTGYRGGRTVVTVKIVNDRITDITVVSNQDTPQFFSYAAPTVIRSIINSQSAHVNAVSGATYTSNGIMQAVADALNKALV